MRIARTTVAMASDDATLPTQAVSGALIRGAFIVLEGLDRSGKTTQAKLLEQRLVEERRPVQRIGFPGEFESAASG